MTRIVESREYIRGTSFLRPLQQVCEIGLLGCIHISFILLLATSLENSPAKRLNRWLLDKRAILIWMAAIVSAQSELLLSESSIAPLEESLELALGLLGSDCDLGLTFIDLCVLSLKSFDLFANEFELLLSHG